MILPRKKMSRAEALSKSWQCSSCAGPVSVGEPCKKCGQGFAWDKVIKPEKPRPCLDGIEEWRAVSEREKAAYSKSKQDQAKGCIKDYNDLRNRMAVLSSELKMWVESGRFPSTEPETQIGVLDAFGLQRQSAIDPTAIMLGRGDILMLSELYCEVPPNAIVLCEELEFACTYELKAYEMSIKMLLEAMASVGRKSRQEATQILTGPTRPVLGEDFFDSLAERLTQRKR